MASESKLPIAGARACYERPKLIAACTDQKKAPNGEPWAGPAAVLIEPGAEVIVETWIEENEKTGQWPSWLVRILRTSADVKAGAGMLIEDASALRVLG